MQNFLIEEIGMEGFKALIQTEYAKPFESGVELLLEKGCFEQYKKLNNGSYAFCYQTGFVRINAGELE